ncbi:MAG TPA: DUF3800 domain-containing protein [Candidatus Angelobacter sp.]|jgi:hypothetical protein|nr:DUF3800 domain-containing protein [Candidatus Angelobacter sp.]
MIVYANKTGSGVMAVVGYAASAEGWACIEKTWTETLELYGVHELPLNAYRNWPEQKRTEFLETLIDIVRKHTSFGVASILRVEDYEGCAPDWFQWENEHPYYFAFQLFFDMFLGTVEKLPDPPLPPGEQLTFVLDQNEFMQRSAGIFLQLKALRDHHDRMGTITFKSRKDCSLLQAVDLTASLVQSEVSQSPRRQPDRDWAQEMRQRYNVIMGVYDRHNIPGLVQRIMATKLKAASANFGPGMRVVV